MDTFELIHTYTEDPISLPLYISLSFLLWSLFLGIFFLCLASALHVTVTLMHLSHSFLLLHMKANGPLCGGFWLKCCGGNWLIVHVLIQFISTFFLRGRWLLTTFTRWGWYRYWLLTTNADSSCTESGYAVARVCLTHAAVFFEINMSHLAGMNSMLLLLSHIPTAP